MYQHIDLMAAHSMAQERERLTQADLRHRETARHLPETTTELVPRPWWHELLVRAHLTQAPTP